jgi:hypothetical protein
MNNVSDQPKNGLFWSLLAAVCVVLAVVAFVIYRCVFSVAEDPFKTAGSSADPEVKQTPTTPTRIDRPTKTAPENLLRTADVPKLPQKALLPVVCDPSYTPATRNDAANRLLNSGDPLLAGKLVSMLRDKAENLTWRNYCVQFLRGCYEQEATRTASPSGSSLKSGTGDGSGEKEAKKSDRLSNQKVADALFEASEYPEPELSSCGIWSLAQLASPKPWANTVPGAAKLNASLLPAEVDARTRELALRALRDEKAHLLVRTGGVQSCARMGLSEAAPDLRTIAVDPKADLSIRTVAVAGLGQLKDEAARELLTQLSNDPSPRLKQAAQMALRALGAPASTPPPAP